MATDQPRGNGHGPFALPLRLASGARRHTMHLGQTARNDVGQHRVGGAGAERIGLNRVYDPSFKPRLRPLEAFPIDGGDAEMFGVRDPSGLSEVVLSVSLPVLQLLGLMDGTRTCASVRQTFQQAFGQPLSVDVYAQMLQHLESAYFLSGKPFDAYYERTLADYRSRRIRDMPHAEALGIIDGSGGLFREILDGGGETANPETIEGTVRGCIAPHLDYERGRPCYRSAYGVIRYRSTPDRIVILGTNHFGRSTSTVSTGNSFRTPLGTTAVDVGFLEAMEDRCGNLRRYELDHVREHSVELQVAWLQHLFGADSFEMVPFLCQDPCGPTGTAPLDGEGVDLADFARSLGEVIAADKRDTLVVAGADLSHVGATFGDDRTLDAGFLSEVRLRDEDALAHLEHGDGDAFVRCIGEERNPTRICSAGCMYAVRAALEGSRANILRYHQAVNPETQTCVTCAAVVFT